MWKKGRALKFEIISIFFIWCCVTGLFSNREFLLYLCLPLTTPVTSLIAQEMVLFYKNSHTYHHNFETVTLAYFNRYPNPYSAHVKSTDTIDVFIDSDGKLHQVKLIKKSGRLPQFIKPFLGKITTSWIIENTIVDPKTKEMVTYNCNLDHRKIIRVEEYNTYRFDFEKNFTNSYVTVKFSSGFKSKFGFNLGIKDRIENWSKNKFSDNLIKSREGLKIVMDSVKEKLLARKLAN